MLKSKHTLSYCNLCEHDIVICYNCQNNCCNGGSKCQYCEEAYEHQDLYFQDQNSISFEKDERDYIISKYGLKFKNKTSEDE